MPEWPTFHMPFKAFAEAYPEGKVLLNKTLKFTKNPVLFLFDHFVEIVFLWATVSRDRTHELLCKTIDHEDDRLHRKEYVWGFNVGKDFVASTQDMLREHDDLINVTVGGRDVVVAYDPEFESVGVLQRLRRAGKLHPC